MEFKKFTNEDGEEIDALSKEEVEKEIEAKAKEFEDKETELNEKLKKFEDKEFNFKALREAKEEDKKKMLEKLSDTERKLFDEQEKNKTEFDDFKNGLLDEHKTVAIDKLCGDDEELKKKVDANFDDIIGETKTQKEMIEKVQKAYNMSVDINVRNPVLESAPSTSIGSIQKKDEGNLSSELKEVGRKLGLSDKKMSGDGK